MRKILCACLITSLFLGIECGRKPQSEEQKYPKIGSNNELPQDDEKIFNLIETQLVNDEPILKEFVKLYNSSTSLGKTATPQKYVYFTEPDVYLYGRYQFCCRVEFNVSQDVKSILNHAEPIITLTEMKSAKKESPDDSGLRFGKEKILTKEEWNKVVENKGDISKIFPEIKKNQPVDGIKSLPTLVDEDKIPGINPKSPETPEEKK